MDQKSYSCIYEPFFARAPASARRKRRIPLLGHWKFHKRSRRLALQVSAISTRVSRLTIWHQGESVLVSPKLANVGVRYSQHYSPYPVLNRSLRDLLQFKNRTLKKYAFRRAP